MLVKTPKYPENITQEADAGAPAAANGRAAAIYAAMGAKAACIVPSRPSLKSELENVKQ